MKPLGTYRRKVSCLVGHPGKGQSDGQNGGGMNVSGAQRSKHKKLLKSLPIGNYPSYDPLKSFQKWVKIQ